MTVLSGVVRSPTALMLALLLLASALRVHRLGEQSLWYDEGVAHAHSLRTLPELIPHLQRNVHVPAYFTVLGWWQDFTGSSEFALRALSALFSVSSVAWTYALGRRLANPQAGLAAAALATLNSFSIYYAQEARMYAMLAAVAGASMWLFAGWLRSPPLRGRRLSAVALGLVNALGLYTHVAYALVIAAQVALAALSLGGRMLRESRGEGTIRLGLPLLADGVLANTLTLLLFLPWLPTALPQLSAQPNLSQSIATAEFLPRLLGVLALGVTYEWSAGISTVAIGLLLIFGLLPSRRLRSARLLPPVWLLVSVGIYLYLELTTRYLRFLLPAQLAVALLLGRGAWMLWTLEIRSRSTFLRALSRIVTAAAFGALLLLQIEGLGALYHGAEFQRDDVRGLVARIESDLKADDAIVVSAAGFSEVFAYYYQGAAPVYGLPASSDGAETRTQVLEIIAAHDRLHVIFYGAEEQDPERIIESTLNLNAFEISDSWVDDMRFAQYKGGAVPLIQQRAGFLFGEGITLESYALGARVVTPGDVLPAQLTWRANAALGRRYKVFLQLLDEDGRLAAQRDSEPAGGSAKTTSWPVDETIVDNHALAVPRDLPAGDYTLIAGLYDISDPSARLPVEGSTYVELGTVTLQ
ncbi:MAG: hypothetical protein F4X02_07865 [Chloroflexi bacterium]|nr:hypothetical protein [Chloroflexota bacterium]